LYLPLARWVKVAADIVLKQAIVTNVAGELKLFNSKITNAAGELKELADMCNEWEKEINDIKASLIEIDSFIKTVILLIHL